MRFLKCARVVLFALVLLVAGTGVSSAASILLYDANTTNNRPQAALASLGLAYTTAGEGNFNAVLAGGTWDLVIMDVPSITPAGGFAGLNAYVAGGGKAILSYWNLDTDPALQAAFGVTVAGELASPTNVHAWDAGHPIFNSPNIVGTLTSWSDIWSDDGDRLNAVGGSTLVAGFTAAVMANQGAIAIGNGGRTIVNGFLFDEINDQNGVNLIANEINFLLAPVPEPASMLLFGMAAVAAGARRLRRRA